MNVIIPMGGIGSRFSKENYRFPKPLVNIAGRPMLSWLIDHLTITKDDTLWIAVLSYVEEQFALSQRIIHEFPHLTIKIVLLTFETRGAAETLYIVLQHMNNAELQKRVISLDCDTIYFSDILADFRKLPSSIHGCSFYFEDLGGKPIFSYLSLDPDTGDTNVTAADVEPKNQQIRDIREKSAISCHANTGAYGFLSGKLLKEYCAKAIDSSVGELGEYYTSQVIKHMIKDGLILYGIYVPSFECVGTPEQLRKFLVKLKRDTFTKDKNRRFCFDLDNTLVTYPTVPGDYTTVQPKWDNIRLVQQLKASGHYIIIQTARRMNTMQGNMGSVIKDIGLLTLKSLDDMMIPYDEIHFGKPYAHVYVDDLGVNALVDTMKELGWCLHDDEPVTNPKPVPGFIFPRSFNTVQEVDSLILKSSHATLLDGEIYFYKNLPTSIAHLFPKVVKICETTEFSSIAMEKVPGITFAHLIVNQCVTNGRFAKLLKALNQIHTTKLDCFPTGAASEDGFVNLYSNYLEKVKMRYEMLRETYQDLHVPRSKWNLSGTVDEVYNYLCRLLKDYETNLRAKCANVIHGDPVFTNVLLEKNGAIRFIDMRGKIGNTLTLRGDVVYDLSKVYQSLQGYDFALQGMILTDNVLAYLNDLEIQFTAFVHTHYPQVSMEDILTITASHYFSIIPLHDPKVTQTFMDHCWKLLDGKETK